MRKIDDIDRQIIKALQANARVSNGGIARRIGKDVQPDFNISSQPFPEGFDSLGFDKHGLNADPLFADTVNGDFHLLQGSPGIDSGMIIEGFTLWYNGSAPDRGAYDAENIVYGPPFHFVAPEGWSGYYIKKPRIVRCFTRGRELAMYFSAELDPKSLKASNVKLSSNGNHLCIENVEFRGFHHAPVLIIADDIEQGADLDISFSTLPVGVNGETATLQGADLKAVKIPQMATLTGDLKLIFSK